MKDEYQIPEFKDKLEEKIWYRMVDVVVGRVGVDPEEITLSSDYVNDLGADSLEREELIMGLECEFDIDIPDEDAEAMKTVQDTFKYLKRRKRELKIDTEENYKNE